MSSPGSATVQPLDHGTSDAGSAGGIAYLSAPLTVPPGKSWQRSEQLALASDHRHILEFDVSSGEMEVPPGVISILFSAD